MGEIHELFVLALSLVWFAGATSDFRTHSSASPKPHPSKPHPCNVPQAKTEVALQFSECCAAETALQHSLFCSAEVILTKSCAAASEKLQCNIEKAALQESGAFLPLSCGFQAPTFRHPRLGPAELRHPSSSRILPFFGHASILKPHQHAVYRSLKKPPFKMGVSTSACIRFQNASFRPSKLWWGGVLTASSH